MTTHPPDFKALLTAVLDEIPCESSTTCLARAAINTPPPPLAPFIHDTDRVLHLAAIIREVQGTRRMGAAALAEAILSHPSLTPIPVSERLLELRLEIEKVLNDARCGTRLVGNIELADRLIDVVTHWAIPLPEVQE